LLDLNKQNPMKETSRGFCFFRVQTKPMSSHTYAKEPGLKPGKSICMLLI